MSDKKPKQDNRDIFEKALDNWPLVLAGGGVLGAIGGRALGKRAAKMAPNDGLAREARNLSTVAGAGGGVYASGRAIDSVRNRKKRK